jgi:hypothetical protein
MSATVRCWAARVASRRVESNRVDSSRVGLGLEVTGRRADMGV